MTDQSPSLDELLEKLVSIDGSDLHLKVGSPPSYRIDGVLHPAELAPLNADHTLQLLGDLLPDRLKSEVEEVSDIDFAYGRAGLGRFRVNAYRQRGSINIVVRSVASTSKTIGELGIPSAVANTCDENDGLIIVTGPAGSGKTTTCAAMVDHINSSRRTSIITIEDPIEVLHRDKLSIVSQREVGVDTPSYQAGMMSALRQDPDVIYVGELRDQGTIEAALVAAETGHLVISTMYTLDALETVRRILDSFPPYLERRVRQMLATTLRAIASQRLIPKADGHGRTVITELLVNTESVQERLIDAARTDEVLEIMAEGAFYGMQTIDQAITKKFESGEVAFADALTHVCSPREFKIAAGVGQAAAM
ncbi:MAG: type IV pilus twitching motility protein PilT [Acidimicrobiia bacterium]